jgi:DNA modification methylase
LEGDGSAFSYRSWATKAFCVLRDTGALFAFTGWSEYPAHYIDLRDAGFKMNEPLIVQKRPSGKTDLYGTFQSNADWLLFGVKGRFRFRPTYLVKNKRAGTVPNKGRKPVPEYKTRMPSCWFGEQYPFSTENPITVKKLGLDHPTVKSLEFAKWLILLTTDPGDLVVDPFCGSGTILLAAKECRRRYIGCDISEACFKEAKKRLY